MSQDALITLYSKESGEFVTTRRARKKLRDKDNKLALKKYSKLLRKVVEFAETKKIFRKK